MEGENTIDELESINEQSEMNMSENSQAQLLTESTDATASGTEESKSLQTSDELQDPQVEIECCGEIRLAAFLKGVNRDVNEAHAIELQKQIEKKGFRRAEAIKVFKPEEVLNSGHDVLVDIYGNEIPRSEYHKYFLVVDGTHRARAVQLYNITAPSFIIPAILAELSGGETVADYLNDINTTIRPWNVRDYLGSAENVHPEIEALEHFRKLMDDYGMPVSTISLIFWGKKGALTKKKLETLCKRQNVFGKKREQIIAEDFDLTRGENFIRICEKIGFTKADIKSRYLIERYNAICDQSGSKEFADEVFNRINTNDISAMRNTKGKLLPQEVASVISRIQTLLVVGKNGNSKQNDEEAA